MAAEALAAHLGRLLLLDQLRAIREAPGRLWSERPGGSAPSVGPGAPVTDPAVPDARAELTAREVDVMRLLAAGETNYRIARLLDITEGTVKTHVSNILRKLDAANRAQAVSRWLRD